MEPSAHTGITLAALRDLRGLSLLECANAAGIEPACLDAIEHGGGERTDIVKVAALFGLHDFDDGEGAVSPDEASAFTVFLLHSATPAFDRMDLRVFSEAMRAARIHAAESPDAGRAASLRRRFTPVAPAGPAPRDAALQGHQLARRVRDVLALPHERVTDMRALLEERFGIPVLVRRLLTVDLRASAALDADRACAAIVLSDGDEARRFNPRLVRVYLAHELCHVLFDPSRAGRVQIALDERMRGASVGPNALLESRAKGFAAEFLLPHAGLKTLFGDEERPRSVEAAERWVRRAADAFQTPREIAMWHLGNLGFYSFALQQELNLQAGGASGPDTTTLPPSGALPICLATNPRAVAAWGDVQLGDASVPEFVQRARDKARELQREQEELEAQVRTVLDEVRAESEVGRLIEATDRLVGFVDEQILANNLQCARATLALLDVDQFSPKLTVTLATLTAHARGAIGPEWADFWDRLRSALLTRWEYSEERCLKLDRRLGIS